MRTTFLPPLKALREVAREGWPGDSLRRFKVDATGWTNLMLEADGWLMFRFPRWPSAARSMGHEVRLLEYLGRHLSVRVPGPLLVGSLRQPRGWPFMAYRKLPGTPLGDLSQLSRGDRTRLAQFLAQLFKELAGLSPGPLRRIGIPPGDNISWSARFERLQHRYEKTGAGEVPAELDREITRQFEEFYATVRESHYRPVLLHNDLWPSHILWDRAVHRPVGVIDWEDARLGDPAFDLTTLRGIGADLMEGLLAARRDPRDRTFNERLLFYRRILPLQSLLFGLETGQRALARTQLHLLRAALRLRSLEDA